MNNHEKVKTWWQHVVPDPDKQVIHVLKARAGFLLTNSLHGLPDATEEEYGALLTLIEQHGVLQAGLPEQAVWSEAKSPADWRRQLHLSETTMRRHMKNGLLMVDKTNRNLWRIRLDTLSKYTGDK